MLMFFYFLQNYIHKKNIVLDQLPVLASVQLTHLPKQFAYSVQKDHKHCRLHLEKNIV